MMFIKEDNIYNETREKSIMQWLDEMSKHEDLAVRDGVKVTRDYIEYLKGQIRVLEEKNQLKDTFLKRLKMEKN